MLMVRLMDGDRDAFDGLFERYSGRLRSFMFRFVGDREVAEDLTQEVFLKLYRKPRSFDPRGRFITWIFAVARNACIDWLRLRKLPVVPVGAGGDGDDPTLEPAALAAYAPNETAVHHELQKRMQEVLGRLSDKLREVFVLCAVQGMSYEDAATVIGCPVKTVSSRLSRARDQFFQSFKKYLDASRRRGGQ
ncbi:MAG: RNA polymerase sigma factor [Planctomycetes bacterium]|nr:RNA polymerase sigma factor [Planctomycetota bacterium]